MITKNESSLWEDENIAICPNCGKEKDVCSNAYVRKDDRMYRIKICSGCSIDYWSRILKNDIYENPENFGDCITTAY